MKITDLNLLEVDIFDGEKIVYSGMCDEVPEEIKQRNIKIDKIDGKKLIIKLE